MELRDAVLAEHLLNQEAEPELKRLLDQHHRLEGEIEALVGRRWLSDQEQSQLKQLKFEKLHGRDRIEAILAAHREQNGLTQH
jgi:uncharacterized protein YdcH (DUF465 family)